MKIRTASTVTAILLAGLLAACSRDEPERRVDNEGAAEVDTSVAPLTEPAAEPTPRIAAPDAAIQSNAIDELTDAPAEAEAPAAPDQQMLDDASATGMTARATRDTPPDEAPAEVVEQK